MTTRMEIPPQDALWLDLETPTSLMVVDALVWFDEQMDWDALRDVLQTRLADAYPSLRRRVVSDHTDHGPYYWEDDPGFSLERHIVTAELPDGEESTLAAYVSSVRSAPLRTDRALWEVHLIDRGDGGAAVLFRVHHAVADGIRVSQILMSMCEDARGRPLIPAPDAEATSLVKGARRTFTATIERGVGDLPILAEDVAGRMTRRASALSRTATGAVARLPQAASHPVSSLGSAMGRVQSTATDAAAAAVDIWTDASDLRLLAPTRAADFFSAVRQNAETLRALLLARTDDAVWTGQPGVDKRVAWSTTVPMKEIRAVAIQTGTSVPEIMMASIAGAVRRQGEALDRPIEQVTWLMPVPVQPFGEALPRELGSLFALLPFEMPGDLDDTVPRLAEIHSRLADLRSGPTSMLAFGLAYLVPYVRGGAARHIMERGAERSVGLLTNLPGPRRTAYLAGSRVSGVMGFAPPAGRQPLSVSIVSYDRQLRVGVAADAGMLDDPQVFADDTIAEFRRLAADVASVPTAADVLPPTGEAGTPAGDGRSQG